MKCRDCEVKACHFSNVFGALCDDCWYIFETKRMTEIKYIPTRSCFELNWFFINF